MAIIEKFNENKKVMYAKFEKAENEFHEALDSAADEFVEQFRGLVESASEEEFVQFIKSDELDANDVNAAIAMRLEGALKRKCNSPDVVVIKL